MSILLALWVLFVGLFDSQPKCPSLWPETTAVFEDMAYLDTAEGRVWLQAHISTDAEKFSKDRPIYEGQGYFSATTTITDAGIELIQIGTITDEASVEHNKRVRECQTANGEF